MNARRHSKPSKIQFCLSFLAIFEILADNLLINFLYKKQEKQSFSSKNVKISVID